MMLMSDDKIKEIEDKSSLEGESTFPEAIFKVISRVEKRLQSQKKEESNRSISEYEVVIADQMIQISNLKTKIENLTLITKRYKLLTDRQEKKMFDQEGKISDLKREIIILTKAIDEFI